MDDLWSDDTIHGIFLGHALRKLSHKYIGEPRLQAWVFHAKLYILTFWRKCDIIRRVTGNLYSSLGGG